MSPIFQPPITPTPRPTRVAGLTAEFDRVNVLFIVADDLGIEQPRCFGIDSTNTYARLPTLEWLAQNGVRFMRTYSMPVCSPTRSCYLTGRYPFRTGIGAQTVDSQQPLLENEMCLPRALTLGTGGKYRLGAFGKWHLSTFLNKGKNHPNNVGFEHYSGAMANLERGKDDFFSWDRIENGVMSRCKTYATTQNVNDALEWINTVEEPWFCYLPFNTVHEPIHRPPADLYDTDTYVLPNVEPQGLEAPQPYLKAMEQSMDREMGRLFAGIKPEMFANTMIFFFSDNGTSAGLYPPNLPVPTGHNKGSAYEFGIRCPLIVSGPGVDEPGRISNGLIATTDFYKTILAVCGADIAQAPSAGTLDSVSFLPMIRNRFAVSARTSVYSETFTPNGPNASAVTPGQRALIGQRYKLLIRGTGVMPHTSSPAWAAANGVSVVPIAQVDQFFDLQDPTSGMFETNDLLGNNGDPTGALVDADPLHPNCMTEYTAMFAANNALITSP